MTLEHPGAFIRREVLPDRLKVTAAAQMLGVGRPALSNLLNGNADLSPAMALRLEKAFGVKADLLLQKQAAWDQAQAETKDASITVRAFAPRLVEVKALQIEAWSERLEARAELAALIRRLVNSTGQGLTLVDFPAFENSQRKGWDGLVDADQATPWIPQGRSGWEFGVNANPAAKAENDYAARTKSTKAAERVNMTYVALTPRNWPGSSAWAASKAAAGEWKSVRAYDASDLEQWIEGSVPAQAWMAARLPLGDDAILSLEQCWAQWSGVAEPTLPKSLFLPRAEAQAATLANWLSRDPQQPLLVTAASQEEALAALACTFETEALRAAAPDAQDRVVVVQSAQTLRQVVAAETRTIIVIASPDAERVSAGVQRKHYTIIVTRRTTDAEPDLQFDLLDHDGFRVALSPLGFSDDRIDQLRRESGGSPTVLRRRLSVIPDVKTPPWAADQALASRIIPLVFVGAWDATSEADQAILREIAAVNDNDDIEATVAALLAGEHSPVWSIGAIRGLVSKIDALYAVAPLVTRARLERFFTVARIVLAETDPALELPEDQRWASAIYGKTRRHSAALRQGVCESLVLLSVHGDSLFKTRLGVDVRGQVNRLVRGLLTPFDPATWQSQRHDLPRYAEAAPETFLALVREDLRAASPNIHALMQPASSALGSSPGRTGLLWALETLAWNPDWLPEVVAVLGALAELKLDDNWANKPENSLLSIFRAWLPQTAATIETRVAVLEQLVRDHPAVGWRICIDQFDSMSTIGHYNARPRWRADAASRTGAVTQGEHNAFALKAFGLAVDWPNHDEATLGDLIQRLSSLDQALQEQVWSKVEAWAATGPTDDKKASLRERLRRTTLTRRGKRKGLEADLRARARAVYDQLEPYDLVLRHRWLFERQWVEESADELDTANFDFQAREERMRKLRAEALGRIWREAGYDGVVRLAGQSEAPYVIGWTLGADVFQAAEAGAFVRHVLADDVADSNAKMVQALSGLLHRLDPAVRDSILKMAVLKEDADPFFTAPRTISLLQAAPFAAATWDLVDTLPASLKRTYWAEVVPHKLHSSTSSQDVNRVTDELLQVERPRAAFFAVEMDIDQLDSPRLVDLLTAAAVSRTEPPGHYQFAQHDISDAFDVLAKRAEVNVETLAQLEFMYLDALIRTKHGISTLERQIGESPDLFVQALTLAFRRADKGVDPPGLAPPESPDLAHAGYTLLHALKRLPGTDAATGSVDLQKLRSWLTRVRSQAHQLSREGVADMMVGQIFGRCVVGQDGIWPSEPVREILEELGTPDMARNVAIGHLNARGARFTSPNGSHDRAEAAKYRAWATQLGPRYPVTAGVLQDLARMSDADADRHDVDHAVYRRLEP